MSEESEKINQEFRQAFCDHDWVPTFENGDTYACCKCGKRIDITEDDTE